MSIPEHSARVHALLSASSAYRWLQCPPSAMLESGEPDKSSIYAQEGTLAHELCEMYLTGKEAEADKRFSAEMHACAKAYKEYVNTKTDDRCTQFTEQRVDFSTYVPNGFGTCDCIIISDKVLTIIDFKFGLGVKVNADSNPQLMLYALGALDAYDMAYDIEKVELCIFQPRIYNVSEWRISVDDLNRWVDEYLKPRAALAAEGRGERQAGEHCRFCRYAAKCKTLANKCLEDFDVEISDLTPERIADILKRERVINAWLKSVKSYAMAQLAENPDAIPGFKLVEGISKRRYADVIKVRDALLGAGYTEAQIYEPQKLIGLTDMTKLLGKKRFGELLNEFIEKPAGAPTIAPISDKRKALDANAITLNDFDDEGD